MAASVRTAFLALVILAATVSGCAKADNNNDDLKRISLPPGFAISLYAEVPGARSIAVSSQPGVIFVGSRGNSVHMVVDRDGDGVADKVVRLVDNLRAPSGLAVHDGWLYIAEQYRVTRWKIPANVASVSHIGKLETVTTDIPDESHHGTRYIAFGPDNRLYVAIGVPCNICMPKGIEDAIISMDPDGQNREIVATGIRNSVGMDFNPKTGQLFFTDNGGDRMGDEIPPDELNRVTKKGQFFGYPYFGGASVRLTGFEDRTPPKTPTPPAVEFAAHTASLGIHFYRGSMFPAEYRGDAFVAQHGSWNRTIPIGYRVMRVRFDDKGNPNGKEIFARGWLGEDETVSGRPVDVKELPDGSLLVSDDDSGVIYRITYKAP